MAYRSNRRTFLQTTSALGVGYWVAGGALAQESKSPNEKIGIASLGYGLKGGWDFEDAAKNGNLVAICETDKNRLANAAKNIPRPRSIPITARCSTNWTRASTPSPSARPTTAMPSFP